MGTERVEFLSISGEGRGQSRNTIFRKGNIMKLGDLGCILRVMLHS